MLQKKPEVEKLGTILKYEAVWSPATGLFLDFYNSLLNKHPPPLVHIK